MHKRERTKGERVARRREAAIQYPHAHAWGIVNGLHLRKLTDDQYQIRPLDREWVVDIYVGRRRLKSYSRTAPRITVPDGFKLFDIVTEFKKVMQ